MGVEILEKHPEETFKKRVHPKRWIIGCAIAAVLVVFSVLGLQLSHYLGSGESHALETIRALTGNTVVSSTEDTQQIQRRVELFQEGQEDYSNMVGWLIIPGTMVDYPVMQSAEKDYYVNHSYDGQSDVYGALFLAQANASDFTDSLSAIYGHDMNNGTMFGDLPDFQKKSDFSKNQEGILILEDGAHLLTVCACLTMDNATLEETVDAALEENGEEWLTALLEAAVQRNEEVELAETDRFLALSTWGYSDSQQLPTVVLTRIEETLVG